MNLKRLFSFTGIILLALTSVLGNGAPATASNLSASPTTLSITSITGVGLLHNTFPWTIAKSVTPDAWDLFRGDMATSAYTIDVTKGTAVEEGFISGEVCITNGAAPTENLKINVGVTQGATPYNEPIITGTVDTSGFPIIPASQSHCYAYQISFPSPHPLNGDYFVTAHAIATNPAEATKTSGGIPISGAATPFHTAITVKDDYANGSWTFTDSGSASYRRQFACDKDAGAQKNTATISFDDDPFTTGSSSSATVTVNCYALDVDKSAIASGSLKYDWSVEKRADQSQLTLAAGETFPVHYWITPTATVSGTGVSVSGSITVTNPAPIEAKQVLKVSDIFEGKPVTVNCGSATFPVSLPTGGKIQCTYSAGLAGSSNENLATATLQNYTYDEKKIATIGATTDFTGTATISGATDACITLTDTMPEGPQGQKVCGGDLPEVITYTHNISTTTSQTISNTVTFETNDTHTMGSASWTVQVKIPTSGCTLSFGYWKTHSKYGPAPFDNRWEALLPNGEDTSFFLSGMSYYQALWTPPKQGNAYFILAHQYIAVVLNKLNGADTSSINGTLDHATALFEKYKPDDVLSKKPQDLRQDFIHTAASLERFNGGYAGITDCSEFTYNLYSIPVPANAFMLFLPIIPK